MRVIAHRLALKKTNVMPACYIAKRLLHSLLHLSLQEPLLLLRFEPRMVKHWQAVHAPHPARWCRKSVFARHLLNLRDCVVGATLGSPWARQASPVQAGAGPSPPPRGGGGGGGGGGV